MKHIPSRPTGFTLYEIMAVIAIMSVLASLMVSSIKSLAGVGHLNRAVEMVSQSAALAHQIALSEGKSVALVLSAADALTDGNQAVLILKGTPDSSGTPQWEAATPWKTLPPDVKTAVLNRDNVSTFYTEESIKAPLTGAGNLSLKFKGSEISKYSYIVFRPDGTVDAPKSGPSLTLKRLNTANLHDDYIILVQENTGRSKVIEP
jgi:prepilin-type N-terminal cleavage/methylation domain-containing protein